jgi:hypothetical protein
MRILKVMTALALVVVACGGTDDEGVATSGGSVDATAPTTPPGVTLPPADDVPLQVFTTSGGQSGNRFFAGDAALDEAPLEVRLEATPAWIVAAPVADRIVWVVADVDGNVSAYAESVGEVEPFPIGEVTLPPGAPPTVIVGGSAVSIFQPSGAAPLAGHGLVAGKPVVIAEGGAVFVGAEPVSGVRALIDGRIVVSGRDEVAFLAEPTERLTHGVLGDKIESESIVVLAPGGATVQAVLDAPGDTVFEALSPMWADVTGDGVEEVIATASDGTGGASLTVFSAAGDLVAVAPPIGTGNRWLNQLAAGPVGPNGGIEVIEVRTPHIGGIVRWYRLADGDLTLQAGAERYSTHRIGSRNLDQGIVVDANGDGRPDVVVPTQDQQTLVALTRTPDESEVVSTTSLGATLATNIAAASRGDGSAAVAVGTDDGRLLIWP